MDRICDLCDQKTPGKNGSEMVRDHLTKSFCGKSSVIKKIDQQKVEATPHPNPTDPALGCATNQPQQGHGFLSSSYIDLSVSVAFARPSSDRDERLTPAKRQPRSYPLVI
jgi:hypothetical protein